MKFKTAHAKVLSLLLTLVMVLSTAAVFAEGTENTASDETAVTTQEEQNVETAEEEPVEEDVVLETQGAAEFSIDDATVEENSSVKITLNNPPAGATFVWASSDENVATVDQEGNVKGVKAGTSTISVTATTEVEGGSAVVETVSCTVIVTAPAFKSAPVLTTEKKYKSGYESANDNGYYLSFTDTGAIGVDHYAILCDGKTVAGMSNIAKADGSKHEVLVPSGTHTYVVRASGNGQYKDSNGAKIRISKNVLANIEELRWYSHTKKKVTLYKTAKLKGKVATLPKGTYVQAIGKSPKKVKKFKQPSKVQVRATVGGKTVVGWVKYNQLKGGVKAATTVSQDFTRSAVEDFVNSHGYSSPKDYLIWVSPRTQRAYLLEGEKGSWKLKDKFRVTTGRFSHKTAPYHSAISKKKAKVWMVTEKGKRYYYKTASYFASGVSFHTGTWWANGKVRGVMNKKGVPQTFGCLRMANSEAGWIYNHVPVGTTVVVKKDAA